MNIIGKLNKEEIFVCEMIWGGVPIDTIWVRNSKKFEQAMIDYKNGKWEEFKNG